MNPTAPERRKTPRSPISALAVLKTSQGPEVSTTQVVDLSRGGARVVLDRPLAPGEEFVLILKAGGEEIVVRGTVVHSHASGSAGLSFTRMSDEARLRLERLLANSSDSPQSARTTPTR